MITGSVGQGGANAPADVAEIQGLLNARDDAGLAVNGICGPHTIAAIEAFQSTVRGVTKPDGLISPDGPTFAALTSGSAPAAAAGAATQPSFPGPSVVLLDLSHNNNMDPIDFGALQRAGVGGIVLKASQGTGFTDPKFNQRLAGAKAANLLVGAYHFGTGDDLGRQVDQFCSVVAAAGASFDGVIAALDVEPNPIPSGTTMTVDQAEAWVGAFRARTKALPLVYGGANHLGANNGSTGRPNLAACPLWIAEYPNQASTRPGPLPGWSSWTLWQYTTGTGGCYAGPFGGVVSDRSVFLGSQADLADLWKQLLAQSTGGA